MESRCPDGSEGARDRRGIPGRDKVTGSRRGKNLQMGEGLTPGERCEKWAGGALPAPRGAAEQSLPIRQVPHQVEMALLLSPHSAPSLPVRGLEREWLQGISEDPNSVTTHL